ncbi:flagellar hook-length control protein FliK [Legionella cardiaca]|uniref:Flagellar hook-length control protein FliK n=1 Tax=Legionella cardiaca TaxID=1071983 RepID=A0ABY8AZF7_9GAMM|nr:flagellar hook-length control protein FliK [Legionella cardiaca]WED44482.1 flagellar hook-length control protein FliK [Legionella cardiaca]
MLDFIQLMSIQQSTEINKKLQIEEMDPQDLQENATFIALMAEFLANQSSENNIEITPVESASEEVLNKELEKLELEVLPIDISNEIQALPLEAQIQTDEGTFAEEEKVDDDSLIENSMPLLWFSATSFEPPANITNITEAANIVDSPVSDTTSTDSLTTSNKNSNPEVNVNAEVIISTQIDSTLKQLNIEDSNVVALVNKNMKESDARVSNQAAINEIGQDSPKLKIPLKIIDTSLESQTTEEITRVPIKATNNLPESFETKSLLNQITNDKNGTTTINSPQTPMNQEYKVVTTNEISPKILNLTQNISNPDWSDNFSQQIMWLGQQKIKTAIIKLNPQELGPLEVNIKLVKEAASVNITTHSNQVRDLIEQTIPRLKDMLSEQGVNLSQVNIESNDRQRYASWENNDQRFNNKEVGEEDIAITPITSLKNRGIVDYFA